MNFSLIEQFQKLEPELVEKINADQVIFEPAPASNISDAILIFMNFSPADKYQPISIAIVFPHSMTWNSEQYKVWLDVPFECLVRINGEGPNEHYQEQNFSYLDKYFYTYSIKLNSFERTTEGINSLLHTLYNHVSKLNFRSK